MNWRSMRARMTVGFVTAIALLLLISGVGLLVFARSSADSRAQTLLDTAVEELRAELKAGQVSASRPAELMASDNIKFRAPGLALLILDSQNHLIKATKSPIPIDLNSNEWLHASIPDQERQIVVAYHRQDNAREINRQAASLAVLGLIVLAASAFGSWALVGRVLSPIDKLAEVARSAPVETTRLQAPSEDAEVERLVSTLNDFLHRLRESGRAKERFYAAASHELRTPLQGLAGFLEIGLARPRERDELLEIVREAQDQSRRLVKLTADLLALNQIENTGSAQAESTEIDIVDVIERALSPLEPLRVRKHLRLKTALPADLEDAEVEAPWSHLEMLVRNLIENAHKYAPDNSEVSIEWDKNQYLLCVTNAISWDKESVATQEKDLDQLFEPFFRMDATREGQVTGNGLGLAICHSICETNNWDISLRLMPTTPRQIQAKVLFRPDETGDTVRTHVANP